MFEASVKRIAEGWRRTVPQMIRMMNADDLDRVAAIWLETNLQAHDFIPSSYWEEHVSLVRELLPQADVWVFEQEGRIDGFIGVVEQAFIAGLFIAAERQAAGIGSALLRHCQLLHNQLSLHVYVANNRAVQFYRKHGFEFQREMTNTETGQAEYEMVWHSEGGETECSNNC